MTTVISRLPAAVTFTVQTFYLFHMSLTDTAAYQNRKAELQAEREDKQKT